MVIENTWFASDIKLRECLLNREACQEIQHASRNLISKDANLVFYISVYKFVHTSNYSDYDVIVVIFCVNSTS